VKRNRKAGSALARRKFEMLTRLYRFLVGGYFILGWLQSDRHSPVRIYVEKSAYHQLSHFEIGGDNPLPSGRATYPSALVAILTMIVRCGTTPHVSL
jgi:hypothetical protein